MKVKLLKKVRRNIRIIRNENGNVRIQERHWYGWDDLGIYEYTMAYRMCNTAVDAVQALLRLRYAKYRRREQIYRRKEKIWTTVWYPSNLS